MKNYYKIIADNKIVGVVTSSNMRRFQLKHKILLICDEQEAQYVQIDDKLYRDDWLVPVTTDLVEYESAQIINIPKSEYDILYESMKTGEEIVITPGILEEPITPPVIDGIEVITVDYVKNNKITEMSNACNKTITDGFNATLSDDRTYHFSLTTQDQLNLITLSTMVANGEAAIPYHADGELCKFYSAEDINIILEAATAHKTFHVSYFNALKAFIESLNTIEELSVIQYGVEIPEAYQSDVLKVLLEQQA